MKTTPKKARQAGFALIVTLSLMILLTVIAVGLLTLSTISLRSTSQGAAQAVANSNARLALMIAIGDLQKHLGPDQRISAEANSFSSTAQQPNVVGVWDSLGWLGGSSQAPQPSEKAEKFRTWLVSTADPESAGTFNYPFSAINGTRVTLSDPKTTGTVSNNDTLMEAQVVPLNIGKSKGGMAWMVSDNSTKVQINIPTIETNVPTENVANRTAAPAPRPEVIDKELAFDQPKRLISLQTAAFAVSNGDKKKMAAVTARSPSLTTSSLGLVTNTVHGGLRTDLTPLMEANAYQDLSFVSGSPDSPGGNQYIYSTATDAPPTWQYLASHYRQYNRAMSGQAGGTPVVNIDNKPDTTPALNITPRPGTERLLPVIAKLQIMFSLVSHHSHFPGRMDAFNNHGVPKGNQNHAVPHLVYDPIVTLYNPYDVQLNLKQIRIRISDPPVGFQFQKHDKTAGTDPWYRPEFKTGAFHSIANFQRQNETPGSTARKFFYLLLREKDGNPNDPAFKDLVLQPGEVRLFSAWVPNDWTWGKEITTNGAFFDHDYNAKLGEKDRRTNNSRGVEAVGGVNFFAGLQTDHMSYGNRPQESKYSWETPGPEWGAGWVSLKLTDDVTVNCRPQRCVPPNQTSIPDFTVDIMSGAIGRAAGDPNSDRLRTYEFRLADPAKEILSTSGASTFITRRFNNEDILQTTTDTAGGGKQPFAIFTMAAKTTAGLRDDSKSWLFNNLVTEGSQHNSTQVGNAAQSYDLSLEPLREFNKLPGVEFDSQNKNRGFFGAVADSDRGVTVVPMFRVPLAPAASLGDWIGSNLVAGSYLPRFNYALGNSFAHPLIASNDIYSPSPVSASVKMLDHSYLMNALFWDNTFFSSAASYSAPAFSTNRDKQEVLTDFFKGEKPLLNSRLIPYISGSSDAEKLANEYGSEKSALESAKSFAGNVFINGAFNVNSASVDAWKAVLSSMRETAVVGYRNQKYDVGDKTAFVRNGLPIAGSADDKDETNSLEVGGEIRWAGFRSLSDDQIGNLATRIVEEIRARNSEDDAPSLCLGDFINRRLGSPGQLHALKGILQTAIEKAEVNANFTGDSNDVSSANLPSDRTRGLSNTAALNGHTGDGSPNMLTQGDLLTALAPIITARGDTFTIRTYGEAKAPNGNAVIARAWCEATVQRIPEYVDPKDPPEFEVGKNKDGDIMKSGLTEANKIFGRRFVVTSFRWLNSTEI